MKILGIDTSTKFLSIGVYNNGAVAEYNLEVGKKLSSLLTVSLKRVLEAVRLEVSDIDYFACGLGPGSFTGLRVGMSAIKGLSWVTKKPIIGISSLDILAQNVDLGNRVIISAVDAKRELIYCSSYKNIDGSLSRLTPYCLLEQEKFINKVTDNSIVLGDAAGLYRERILSKSGGAIIADKDAWYPKGHNIIELALRKIKDKKLSNAFNIRPLYLYPKECQIKT